MLNPFITASPYRTPEHTTDGAAGDSVRSTLTPNAPEAGRIAEQRVFSDAPIDDETSSGPQRPLTRTSRSSWPPNGSMTAPTTTRPWCWR